jgi:hypothetical protein
MSNLISYASPWTNEEQGQPKRRTSSIRRTYKKQPIHEDTPEENEQYEQNKQNQNPTALDNIQNMNENKNTRVNELLNRMSTATAPLETNKMGEFTPISPPSVQVKTDTENTASSRQYVPPPPSYLSASNAMKSATTEPIHYKANDQSAETYNDYNKSYQQSTRMKTTQPYYANMGISTHNNDNKFFEKINYMIHMLEEQQYEKTNNITEEFLLYTFLGVFVIYVLDSFARSGKYIR